MKKMLLVLILLLAGCGLEYSGRGYSHDWAAGIEPDFDEPYESSYTPYTPTYTPRSFSSYPLTERRDYEPERRERRARLYGSREPYGLAGKRYRRYNSFDDLD